MCIIGKIVFTVFTVSQEKLFSRFSSTKLKAFSPIFWNKCLQFFQLILYFFIDHPRHCWWPRWNCDESYPGGDWSDQWFISVQCSKSAKMENFTQRFFCSWRWTRTNFENEKAFCASTICRFGQWILWVKFYKIIMIFNDDEFYMIRNCFVAKRQVFKI